jgi:hypothetical protein
MITSVSGVVPPMAPFSVTVPRPEVLIVRLNAPLMVSGRRGSARHRGAGDRAGRGRGERAAADRGQRASHRRRPGLDMARRIAQPDALAGGQEALHHQRSGVVLQAQDMADLVKQDREQVDPCCTAEIRRIGRGGINEPAVAVGGRVQRDGQAIGEADLAGGKIGDADLQLGEPELDGVGEKRGDFGVGNRRRAGLDILETGRNQRAFKARRPSFFPVGRIGER